MKEVVQKMSGIDISEEVTNDQLEALHGGEILKAEVCVPASNRSFHFILPPLGWILWTNS